mmetsp:Transcript_17640/g.55241  ORF Transcript_17640/g.55241 Transcript_17640/m.55241 type:complete len:127 (+) Transcript_17640:1066-1446(+)
MERLECFIEADAAADKNAEIEKCLKAPRPDTSHLNISFPSLPPNPGCQDPVIYPCSHPYLAAIRVSGIDLPACQVCSLPSPGPSPPPPSPSPSPLEQVVHDIEQELPEWGAEEIRFPHWAKELDSL